MFTSQISPRRWLHLPIETKSRELDAKMLLACTAAERGWGAIIGDKNGLRKFQKLLPRGVFVEKSIGPRQIKLFAFNKKHGNRVAAWCEEGLTYFSKPEFFRLKFDDRAFAEVDYFFAWGKWQADAIKQHLGKCDSKTVICGNPRLDMLRPEMRPFYASNVEKLKVRHNRTILINTNFAATNLNSSKSFKELLRRTGEIPDQEIEMLVENYVAFQARMLEYFSQALPALAQAFPHHTIIIRPHPSESHAYWDSAARPYSNVKVIFEGSAIDWILASDVLIQNNCTTGAEAFLLKSPCIAYQPFKDPDFDDELINGLGHAATSLPKLIEMTKAILDDRDPATQFQKAEREALALKHMSFDHGRLASDRILDHLELLELPVLAGNFYVGAVAIRFINLIKKLLRGMKSGIDKKYTHQKFPGLSLDEMNDIVRRLGQATGRFQKLSVGRIAGDLYCVYSK